MPKKANPFLNHLVFAYTYHNSDSLRLPENIPVRKFTVTESEDLDAKKRKNEIKDG